MDVNKVTSARDALLALLEDEELEFGTEVDYSEYRSLIDIAVDDAIGDFRAAEASDEEAEEADDEESE